MGVVNRYVANPGKEHWEAVKWLPRYLRGTSSTSLCFGEGKVTLQGFVDVDLAEYVAIAEAGKEIIWLADYLEELGKKQSEKILYSDSQSTIQFVKNPVYHSKTKHIRRRYHFTRKAVEDGDMCLEKIEGARKPADMLTKCVDVGKLRLGKTSVGLL